MAPWRKTDTMGHSMKILAALSVSMLFVLPLAAQAQGGPAANACWNAVTREARGMLNANNISRVSNAVQPMGNGESLVSGVGRADNRTFSYRCTYNMRNDAVYAVQLTPEGGNRPDMGRGPGGPNGGFGPDRPINTGDVRRAAEQSCYDATLSYAQRQNPTASNFKIFLSQNRFEQVSNIEIRVSGQGEMRQIDRLRGTWDYACVYNARTGRVRDISLGRFIPNR
jgi:hypothetical protein